MSQVSLALLIHAHQPVGNFDHVIEDACTKSYAPFLQLLARHPDIRVSLHFSGFLLEWIETRHPELAGQILNLSHRGQIELVGGGFYEPIFPAIPDRDKKAQIQKLADHLQKSFGRAPRGAWVTERVWESSLARPLSEAGVEYCVLDDTHFLTAGLEPHELYGVYITEETGHPLRLVPSLKSLRYAIPFREPAETINILRQARDLPQPLVAVGDDYEKFGGWPGTFEHCYTNGWLERFFHALEAESAWVRTTTLSDYIASHPPLGRIYLPATSYDEMAEWSLPVRAAQKFKKCLDESHHTAGFEKFQSFLRGGIWRNFFAKYTESNHIHKLMIEISNRLEQVSKPGGPRPKAHLAANEAREHLLAGQCNDAYWHGIFGGLYAPHLRFGILRELIQAESLLDKAKVKRGKRSTIQIERKDFDIDGREELLVSHPQFGMVVNPSDGATVSSLRFKPAASELINSLMRRPEAYHDLVRQAAASGQAPREGPASIHDMLLSKDAHLESLLQYDRYRRHAFRTYLFPSGKQWQDFAALNLQESSELAAGAWGSSEEHTTAGIIAFEKAASINDSSSVREIEAFKQIQIEPERAAWVLACRTSIGSREGFSRELGLATEMVFNLLAPNAPDRYFSAGTVRYPLEFGGEIVAEELWLTDEWQKIRIALTCKPICRWWISPIETISQSESGFERVYQGSAILAVWHTGPPPGRSFTASLQMKVTST